MGCPRYVRFSLDSDRRTDIAGCIAAQRGFRRLRHRRQLRSIGADVGDLVRDNQMVRGVDRTLHVVGDHA